MRTTPTSDQPHDSGIPPSRPQHYFEKFSSPTGETLFFGMKLFSLNTKRLKLISMYSLFSAVFSLFVYYPWLVHDPEVEAAGLVLVLPTFVTELEIVIMVCLSIATWFGRRFSMYFAAVVFLLKLLSFGLLHTIYAYTLYSYDSLSLLRLGIWFMITQSLWYSRESSIFK